MRINFSLRIYVLCDNAFTKLYRLINGLCKGFLFEVVAITVFLTPLRRVFFNDLAPFSMTIMVLFEVFWSFLAAQHAD